MPRLTIYQKPTCTTCRSVAKILKEAHVDFDAVDYYIEPIGKGKLKELLRKLHLSPRELLRSTEPVYRKLQLSAKSLTDEQILDLLVEYPDLLQRPIVEMGNKAILARPPERIREMIKE